MKTTVGNHNIDIGDNLTIDLPDMRWYIRLWCFITRKDLPYRAMHFKVSRITSKESFTIEK